MLPENYLKWGILLSVCSAQLQIELDDRYSRNESPLHLSQSAGPFRVNASFHVRNILEVEEKTQVVTLATTLRLYWKDWRIKLKNGPLLDEDRMGHYTTLPPSLIDKIWIPSIFIDEVKAIRVASSLTKPASLRIYNDSSIVYSSRLNFDLACDMHFHWYPIDQQTCRLNLQPSNKILLSWQAGDQDKAVKFNIILHQFSSSVQLLDGNFTDDFDETSPSLIVQLTLKRSIRYHIVATFIPSSIFVVISWSSMFISAEMIPGRVGMMMTINIAMAVLFSGIRQVAPKTSYFSPLDVWMLICFLFLFSTILESVGMVILNKTENNKELPLKFERTVIWALPVLFLVVTVTYWIILLS